MNEIYSVRFDKDYQKRKYLHIMSHTNSCGLLISPVASNVVDIFNRNVFAIKE